VRGPHPVLSTVGPNAVEAGGTSFTLVIAGTNFSTFSIGQWDGAELQTMQQSYFNDMHFAGGLSYSGTSGVFNPATNTTLSPFARFASPQGGSSLIRWGTNGLAFATGGVTPTVVPISGSIVSR
jgi:hypothetical protein